MSLQQCKAYKLTVEAARDDNNIRHRGNSVRGTNITVSMVFQYFVSGSLI
jgi:hypothetical protein